MLEACWKAKEQLLKTWFKILETLKLAHQSFFIINVKGRAHKNSAVKLIEIEFELLVSLSKVQLIAVNGSYISWKGKFLSISYWKKRHRIPAADILSNDTADTILNCIPLFLKMKVYCFVQLYSSKALGTCLWD